MDLFLVVLYYLLDCWVISGSHPILYRGYACLQSLTLEKMGVLEKSVVELLRAYN